MPSFSLRSRLIAVALTALMGGGCVHVAPDTNAAMQQPGLRLERRLDAPDLRAALAVAGMRPPAAGEAWTFDALCWVAFYERADLAVARAQWNQAVAEGQGATERPNPTVSVNPGYNSSVSSPSPWFPSIDFDIPITGQSKRAADRRRLEQAAESRRQGMVVAAWQVRRELWSALVNSAGAECTLDADRQLAAVDRALAEWWEQRINAGEVAASDPGAIGAQLALARSVETVSGSEQALAGARQRVAAALGLPLAALHDEPLPDVLAESEPIAANAGAWRMMALQERADVRAALADYAAAQATVEREVARQYPDLHLGPGYQWDQGASKWSLVATMEWPIFSRNRAAIDAAVAQRDLAAAQVEAVQAAILAELDAAETGLAAANDRLAAATATRAAEQAAWARAEARWHAGEADRLEVLQAGRERALGAQAQVVAQTEMAQARGAMEAALQRPFAAEETLIATHQPEPQSP